MIVVGLPFCNVHPDPLWTMAMLTMKWPINCDIGYIITKNMPVDAARQHIAERAVELGAKYLWFVDDDTLPPTGAIRALKYEMDQRKRDNVGIVAAIVCTKTDPPEPVVFQEKGDGAFWDWTVGEVFPCKRIGTGCMLISVDMLKQLPKPWFKLTDDQSESMYFCQKAREAGYKIMAHGGVICEHLDNLSGISYNLPIDSAPMKNRAPELVLSK